MPSETPRNTQSVRSSGFSSLPSGASRAISSLAGDDAAGLSAASAVVAKDSSAKTMDFMFCLPVGGRKDMPGRLSFPESATKRGRRRTEPCHSPTSGGRHARIDCTMADSDAVTETHAHSHRRPSLLRSRDHRAHVTNVELFFDLVFVFAVTQLSHTLLEHLSLRGALQTAFLLLSVWWVWMYTCWFTNWIDPDRPTVRMLMFALMLAGLLMSAAIPNAFESEGLLFALAYSFIQVVRTLFIVLAARG